MAQKNKEPDFRKSKKKRKKNNLKAIKINIELPVSMLSKMILLRNEHPKLYYYLSKVTGKFFKENINICEVKEVVKYIRFSLTKGDSSLMQLHLVTSKPCHLFSEENNILKRRMENFYKFSSDIDYFLTVLYFFCKYYDVTFHTVPDFVFNSRLDIVSTNISFSKDEIEQLITFNIDTSGKTNLSPQY